MQRMLEEWMSVLHVHTRYRMNSPSGLTCAFHASQWQQAAAILNFCWVVRFLWTTTNPFPTCVVWTQGTVGV